jgi:hypothetical protein
MLPVTLAIGGCFPVTPLPPTAGYGAPYKGTGEGIYVKDSRTDWDITEGHHKITSEQALEASGDPEYEPRRQIAKAYNDRLYREAQHHHKLAYRLIGASIGAIVVGGVMRVLATSLQSEAIMPPTSTTPEMQTYTSGFSSDVLSTTGSALIIAGVCGIPYAYIGGRKPPPYHDWHTPGPLARPAYVRQQTETYNERVAAPSVPEGLPPPPGVVPPRHIPRPRGGR